MTREEAIAYGKRVIDLGLNDETQAFCEMAINALEQEPTEFEEIDFVQEHKKIPITLDLIACDDAISRQAIDVRLREIINEIETIFADIREKNVDDSVCGLCEYDCDHGLDGFANECPGFEKDDCFKLKEKYRTEWLDISNLPPVTPQPKMGRWIHNKCDKCGASRPPLFDNYCPNCGARMGSDKNTGE